MISISEMKLEEMTVTGQSQTPKNPTMMLMEIKQQDMGRATHRIVRKKKLKAKMNFVEDNVKVDLSTIPEEDFNLFIKPFITKESLHEIRESLGN